MIGANDYALEWYSHNEYDGDFGMEQFSIERDQRYLIPYVRAAMLIQSELRLFASPWSPPTWMKQSRVYNNGVLRWEPVEVIMDVEGERCSLCLDGHSFNTVVLDG